MASVLFRIILLFTVINWVSISHAQEKSATTILLFGDSIIAGYGLEERDSLPVQLEKFFEEKGRNVKVINGGVSGDTTAGGRSRLEWSLKKYHPDIVLIALGGNDVMRGASPANVRENLDAMLKILKSQKTTVVLSMVQAPTNLGAKYMADFNKIFPDLAKKYQVFLYPFLLEKTFGNNGMMQSDGIHPTAEGVKVIANDLGFYLLKRIPK